MDFKAAVFDFDGTITEKGVYHPSPEMCDGLFRLSEKMPIAFCTGRQLESFLRHGYEFLLAEIPKEKHADFLGNLHLLAENGSVGYYYDVEVGEFKEFYRADWPGSFYPRDTLMKEVEEAIKGYGDIYYNAHKVIVVMRTKFHDYENRKVEDIYECSGHIYDLALEFLKKIDENFEDFVHLGNSGIGCLICPADGDKDRGIKEFADYLARERGASFGENAREIVVVGDRPQPSGNDYYLLKGDFGTPYTVGCLVENADFPKAVIDDGGKRLLHADGTLFLVNSILS